MLIPSQVKIMFIPVPPNSDPTSQMYLYPFFIFLLFVIEFVRWDEHEIVDTFTVGSKELFLLCSKVKGEFN